jgi:hypothetical protein
VAAPGRPKVALFPFFVLLSFSISVLSFVLFEKVILV